MKPRSSTVRNTRPAPDLRALSAGPAAEHRWRLERDAAPPAPGVSFSFGRESATAPGEAARLSTRRPEPPVATGRLPQVHVERLARLRVRDLEAYVRGLAQNEAPQSDRGPRDNPG